MGAGGGGGGGGGGAGGMPGGFPGGFSFNMCVTSPIQLHRPVCLRVGVSFRVGVVAVVASSRATLEVCMHDDPGSSSIAGSHARLLLMRADIFSQFFASMGGGGGGGDDDMGTHPVCRYSR